MDSYSLGYIMGQATFWLIFFGILWGVVKLFQKLYALVAPNPIARRVEEYLFWVDFVQGISSIEDFKQKLKKISNKKIYKDENNRFYLSKEEASSQRIKVDTITVKEVLSSETYPLFLITRLERISLYSKEDLPSIKKTSRFIWCNVNDIFFFMILDKGKILYPKDYPTQNIFRFGYEVFYDDAGMIGIYDVENDILSMPFEYLSIQTFGNIVEVSKDLINYEIYDLDTKERLSISQEKTFPNIPLELKKKINLSKIELKDYIKLFPILQTKRDLQNIGLWEAKVAVMQVPDLYEEIIEDSNSGYISWSHPVSADIYNMSIELPVRFKKKNGEYVSLGIKFEYLVLEDRESLKNIINLFEEKKEGNMLNSFEDLLKRGNLPDDDRVVPNYLKIKNSQYDDVDWKKNNVETIIKLSSDEFNELVSQTDNGLLFTFLSTLSKEELEKFYKYNEEVVKLKNGAEESAREQFEKAMASINKDEITNIQRARATLEMPLAIAYAKNLYGKTIAFRMFRTYDYYQGYQNEIDARFEVTLSNIIWEDLGYIPDYFEQVLKLYRDAYDENSEYHQKIFEHLVKRFGLLIATLNRLIVMTENRDSSLNWFTGKMVEYDAIGDVEISVSKTREMTTDKKLINFITLTFLGIVDENEDNYLQNLINVTNTLFEWYPVNSQACEYAMVEMMKSVAIKKVSIENANAFIEFFEELPRFYDVLSYDKIMELKEMINHTLADYKPQDNEIFDNKEVKNKLILLNYLIDMEDLFYKGK
jgi:hypothetical protein